MTRGPRATSTQESRLIGRARSDGYLILQALLDPPMADALTARISDLVRTNPPGLDAAGGTVYLPEVGHEPLVRQALTSPDLVRLLGALLGSTPVLLGARYRSPKPGGGRQSLHRDQPWPMPDGTWAAATVIIGLIEFTSTNGATRLVPGTHLDRSLSAARDQRFSHPDEVLMTGPAGTAYVFTGAALHSGTTNHSGAERPGIQASFVRSEGSQL